MTLGIVWTEIATKNDLTESDVSNIAEWAFRVYFGPSSEGKRWYKSSVTIDTVLNEFLLPESPISPDAMTEIWKAIPSLRASLERLELSELDSVAEYLSRPQGAKTTPRYTQGDATLKEMAESLGGITGTMVNKICVSGTDKLQRLTGGISPADMEADDLVSMFFSIERTQLLAASEYAKSLRAFRGDVQGFIQSEIDSLHLTDIEAKAIKQEEIEGLRILSEMEYARIVAILVEDIGDSDNLFLGFQNAASRKVFPRRSGRPKGSGKKKIVNVEVDGFDETQEI